MRVLVPSHLAYGKNGAGTGSITLTNGRIAGNQCLDYTIELVDDPKAYDEVVIKNYLSANNLSGFTETADGLWYKITTVGTGASITDNSYVVVNYVVKLMNNTVFQDNSSTTYPVSDLSTQIAGFVEGIKLSRGGGAISLIIPSRLAYGNSAYNGIPANSCLRYDISNITVTNY
jgi:FKBP-type peptidyl-prolyl cis-trans isomerase